MLKMPLIAALLLVVALSAVRLLPQTVRNPNSRQAVVSSEALVDINHARLEQLLQVPGLTRPWAERIVRFRPYRSKLDLLQEGVLPGAVYNRIKDHVIAHRDKE